MMLTRDRWVAYCLQTLTTESWLSWSRLGSLVSCMIQTQSGQSSTDVASDSSRSRLCAEWEGNYNWPSPDLFCEYSSKLFLIIISSVLFQDSAESDVSGVLHIWAQHLSQLTLLQKLPILTSVVLNSSIGLAWTRIKSLEEMWPTWRPRVNCVIWAESECRHSDHQRRGVSAGRWPGRDQHPAQAAKHGDRGNQAALNTSLSLHYIQRLEQSSASNTKVGD